MTLRINKSAYTMPVYSDYGMPSWGTKVGDIYVGELYTEQGFFSEGNSAMSISFYSPNGWKGGYIKYEHWSRSGAANKAFSSSYDLGTQADGYEFKVKLRQCRIFSGENHVATIYPGDFIVTDGYSSSGSKYPYRLSIKGYRKAGSAFTTSVTNGWCDTDIELGYSMHTECTLEGTW